MMISRYSMKNGQRSRAKPVQTATAWVTCTYGAMRRRRGSVVHIGKDGVQVDLDADEVRRIFESLFQTQGASDLRRLIEAGERARRKHRKERVTIKVLTAAEKLKAARKLEELNRREDRRFAAARRRENAKLDQGARERMKKR